MPVVLREERPLTLTMILGMAPDHATLRTAEVLAQGETWAERGVTHGPDGAYLWATFAEGQRKAIQTAFDLSHLYASCSCAAIRFPCRHLLALLLREQDEPAATGDAPEWALAALDKITRDGRATAGPDETADRRLAVMTAGMDDLGRWLADQVRRGLATLPARGRRPWHEAADRLVDAYATGAAREMRALAAIPGSGPDWPDRLLPRLGRLALLAEGFRRLGELPPGERGDLVAAAGWLPRVADDRVHDQWLVAGRGYETESRQAYRRTWLRGLDSGRWALLETFWPRPRSEGLCLPVGAVVAGELGFPPSAWPLAALPLEALRWVGQVANDDLQSFDIDSAIAGFAAARAANPWLRRYPMLLGGAIAEPARPWRLRDRGGRVLPLPPGFAHGWSLLALAADRPVTLFGEWDGATLTPLSARGDDAIWRDMTGWRGVP